jgi:hypothetical protein
LKRIIQHAKYGLLAIFCIIVFLGVYSKSWEAGQPKEYVQNAKVRSIEPYKITNDLHWSSRGYKVRIVGENKLIDFSSKSWDDTVRVGDTVNAVVRMSFPWFGLKDELDGLSIYSQK